jgi:hypothetical protein
MSQDAAIGHGWNIPLHYMQVCPTNSRLCDPYDGVSGIHDGRHGLLFVGTISRTMIYKGFYKLSPMSKIITVNFGINQIVLTIKPGIMAIIPNPISPSGFIYPYSIDQLNHQAQLLPIVMCLLGIFEL